MRCRENKRRMRSLLLILCTPYQVSFSVQDAGKTLEKSKKVITWTFVVGENNNKEHVVALKWSKVSGRQRVLINGTKLYFEKKQRSKNIFQQKVKLNDGDLLNLHVLASRATPKENSKIHFQKYELIINGTAFSMLPTKDGNPPKNKSKEDGKKHISILEILYPNGYKSDNNKHSSQGEAVRPLHVK
jgi:hypothetical protein